jgi:protein SCO1/2
MLTAAECGKNISEVPYYNTPDFTPLWISSKDADEKNIHKVNDFVFTNQDGKRISMNELKGKIYIANFFYTTCTGICSRMTQNLLKIQNTFVNNDNVKMISFSVMPKSDSVPQLKSYETSYKIKNDKWHLLTGNKSDIYNLARRSYFAEENEGYNSDSTQFLHTEHVLLVDRKGYLRGVYNGTLPLEIDRLTDDIKILLSE